MKSDTLGSEAETLHVLFLKHDAVSLLFISVLFLNVKILRLNTDINTESMYGPGYIWIIFSFIFVQ